MDLGSDTTAGASLVHSDELRALEQSFQDQLSALQLRVTSLEYRLHPASLRAAGSDSGSNLSVVVGESLEDIISAEPSLLPLLWESLTVADRLSLLQASWYIRTSVERELLGSAIRYGWPKAQARQPQAGTARSAVTAWFSQLLQ